ncbi:5-formyltetrahydrofolate cyclo-ligase [Actinomycetospora sp. OC33-EN08]|uniref:5-formyltetrahydrofolate cyclo-ligase n=1 Tax=Actinomycetospora aurantiaca TaxID=3129233 RepID=A0ABU8MUW8_9PSEU
MAGPAERPGTARSKSELRTELLARRRARSEAERWQDAANLAAALPDVLESLRADPARPVCLYVPVRSEPGATPNGALPVLDAAVAIGRRVLLPVVSGDAPLDWAGFRDRGDLRDGPHGLLEPSGRRVGPGAVADAAVVVVPALAASPDGVRLGRGGGHYDRSLPLISPSTVVVAVVGDTELLPELPVEPHDVRVHAVWRPTAGLVGTA